MNRYACIHGHFYQPPRENPWLEEVELQDSAYPYHDWNEKITEECYRPNAASRILGPDRRIIDIVNNYSHISFDFGPTLLIWLQRHQPDIYQSILDADKQSREIFSGHGAAIAQAYNHIIMPLANSQDKRTQVIWGIRDFQQRFQREPEGMWLPETAVDLETLDLLAQNGIRFTILSPHQARRVRRIGAEAWQDVPLEAIDTTRAYLCRLQEGRTISLFFYRGPVSRDVAYGKLLDNGEMLAKRIVEHLEAQPERAQLADIATDGETFGHHHRLGDMALAYCLHYLQTKQLAAAMLYGEFLEKFKPEYEVQIVENTSWSCGHGVERWKSNCGCAFDPNNAGKQQWRGALRQAMDWLRDQLIGLYETQIREYAPDPWQVRNDYIGVVMDRAAENMERFSNSAAGRELTLPERVHFYKLLEMQRNAMLMYTSCGWFFDQMTGIEAVQIMLYASRAMQLAKEVQGPDLEPEYMRILEQAPVTSRQYSNGRQVYEALVKSASIDLNRVGVHLAVSSVFDAAPEEAEVYCYTAKTSFFQSVRAGVQKLVMGRAAIQSRIVLEEFTIDFAVLHFGDHNLVCSVSAPMPEEELRSVQERLRQAFVRGDTTEVMRLMNVLFKGSNYSLWHLFKDEQRRILHELLKNTWEQIEASFREVYTHNYSIMQVMRSMGMPLPLALSVPAEFILNYDLGREIQRERIDLERLAMLAEEVARLSLKLDEPKIRYEASHRINQLAEQFKDHPDDMSLLTLVDRVLQVLSSVVPQLDLNGVQNALFAVGRKNYRRIKKRADGGDDNAKQWLQHFDGVAQRLGIVIQ